MFALSVLNFFHEFWRRENLRKIAIGLISIDALLPVEKNLLFQLTVNKQVLYISSEKL